MTDLAAQVTALNEEQKTDFFEKVFGNLTVKECLTIVKRLEDVFDIEAKPQMPEFGQTPEAEEVEQTEFSVVVTDVGSKKIAAIKAVRTLGTGLDLKGAKALLENLPATIKEKVSREDAESIKKTIEESGATAEIK